VFNAIRIVGDLSLLIALAPPGRLTTGIHRLGEQDRRSNFSRKLRVNSWEAALARALILWLAILPVGSACSQRTPEAELNPAGQVASKPVVHSSDASLGDGEQESRSEQVPIWGEKVPEQATSIHIERKAVGVGGKKIALGDAEGVNQLQRLVKAPCRLLLSSDSETYLVEAGPMLRIFESSGCEVWLRHPEAPVAFKIALRDESEFARWLDEPKPGKIRVIQRADGFELQTSAGKMAGPDTNGPTVPTREGQLDIGRMRGALLRLKKRFSSAPDACLVPSFGTELSSIAKALSGYYRGPGEPLFEQLCLVYPR
jgi:hypothetical protein